ncbi:MAG TPA: nuclear transport factor 2 family protein [Acidimicrobiia bacterium]
MLGVADVDDVRAANASFYAAFEARDLDAMAEVWERSDRARVTHPGWPTLHGWARVAGSWQAIFSATPFIQFVLTDEDVLVDGDLAMVTLDENILQSASPAGDDTGELAGARVATTNVFVRAAETWHMVNHHGSPVHSDVSG